MTLVFSHVPKTAGTSLRATLTSQFRKRKVLLDYGPESDFTSDAVRHLIYEENDFYKFGEYLRKKRIKLVAGHFDSYRYAPLVGSQNVISVIREPSSRILSEYKHLQRMGRYNNSFDSFIKENGSINKQVKWLGNIKLPLLGFVGITESYGSSIDLLNKLYGLKLKNLELNKTSVNSKETLSIKVLEDIRRLNRLDGMFYQKVNSWMDIIQEQLIKSDILVRGWVDYDKNADSYVGACWLDSRLNGSLDVSSIAEVQVKVDDKTVLSVAANKYNKYVAQYSSIRNGYVGFVIPASSMPKGEKIEFVNSFNKCRLFGSP